MVAWPSRDFARSIMAVALAIIRFAKSVLDFSFLLEAASCFASFDARGSGSLDESQFGALVTAARRAVGGPAPTAAQLADTFTEADVGADGSIDFSEFALYVRAHVDADLALVVATHTFSAEPDGH